MKSSPRLIAAVCAALLTAAAPQIVRADDFSASQHTATESIVHEYLIAHREVLQEPMNELERRQSATEAEKHKVAVKDNALKLFSSPHQVVLGNPEGNVTFVAFV